MNLIVHFESRGASELSLLVGQLNRSDGIHVYEELVLSEELCKLAQDLSQKSIFSTFLDQINEIIYQASGLVGFGFKPIGLLFKNGLPEYLKNMNILKKIAQVFDVKQLLLAGNGFKQLQKFDLIGLKVDSNLKVQFQKPLPLLPFRLDVSVVFPISDGFQQQGKEVEEDVVKLINRYKRDKLFIDGKLQTSESLLLKDIIQYKQEIQDPIKVSLFRTQSQSKMEQTESTTIQGVLIGKVFADLNTSVVDLKQLLIDDMCDSMVVRLNDMRNQKQENTYDKLYLLKRVELGVNELGFSLQDYSPINEEMNIQEFQDRLKKGVQGYSLRNASYMERPGKVVEIPIVQQLPVEQTIEQQPQLQQQEEKKEQKQQVHSYKDQYIFLAVIVLLISVYAGYRIE